MGKTRTKAKERPLRKPPKKRTATEKRRQIRKKDVTLICNGLEEVDIEELRGAVILQVDAEYHVGFSDDRN